MAITCKQATEYIVKQEEGKLTLRERYKLFQHKAVCKLCSLFARQNKFLSSSIKNSRKHESILSEEDKQAIIKAMNEEVR